MKKIKNYFQFQNFPQFLQRKKYPILVGLILLFTFWVHFYRFDMRWGLGNDDSRDAMIALEALKRGELPLIGSFSSAGPFVFGPFFYWFIMLCYLLVPFVLNFPWMAIGVLGVITVMLLMYCAQKIAGNNFALLVGVLAVTSPQLVARSVSLGQHTFISLLAVCMILCFLFFFEKKKLLYAFLVGFCVGAAINFHYQAINLLFFLPVLLFVSEKSWRFKLLSCSLAFGGVLLALSPLIIWDSQQQFANFRNILDYFLIVQYRLYVPNSWRLFVFTNLPQYWAYVVGGNSFMGLITMFVVGGTTLLSIVKKQFPNKLFFFLIPFVFLIVLNRFYKGERSEGYLLYFLPFILLFTAYTFFTLFQKGRFALIRRLLAAALLIAVIIGNAHIMQGSLLYQTRVASLEKVIDKLITKYPNKKFAVYDYKNKLAQINQPLGFLLTRRHLSDPQGMPIGFLCYVECPVYPKIAFYDGLYLADLRKEKNIKSENPRWVNVNPEGVYDDLIGWSKRHELRSTFFLDRYITDKLPF